MQIGARVRWFVARHRWVRWLTAAGLAAIVAGSLLVHAAGVEEARRTWSEHDVVLVADGAHDPGDPLRTTQRRLPLAAIPPSALVVDHDRPAVPARLARQRIADGEIVVEADVAVPTGPAALADDGTVTVAIDDVLVPTAPIGAHVAIAAEGITIAGDGIVVAEREGVVFVAVAAEAAPLVAHAAQQRTASILFTR